MHRRALRATLRRRLLPLPTMQTYRLSWRGSLPVGAPFDTRAPRHVGPPRSSIATLAREWGFVMATVARDAPSQVLSMIDFSPSLHTSPPLSRPI